MRQCFTTVLLILVAVWTAGAATVTPLKITATLVRSEVPLDESAELLVTAYGATSVAPIIPDVEGLYIRYSGQSTSLQFKNGEKALTKTFSYVVISRREGIFIISGIKIGDSQAAPLTLRVTKSEGAPQAKPPGLFGGPSTSHQSTEKSQVGPYGSLESYLAKKQFYVGETVPFMVRARLPFAVRVANNGIPALRDEAFDLLTPGEEPLGFLGGKLVSSLAWPCVITAVKPGEHSVGAHLPIIFHLPKDSTQKDANPEVFISQMDQFFHMEKLGKEPKFTKTRMIEATLVSPPAPVTVLPLPEEGRPADYQGAVGSFEITVTAEPQKPRRGERITLKMAITGKGNFASVNPTLLPNGSDWKTSPPKGAFVHARNNMYEGTKTFEQTIVPTHPRGGTIPALTFSYFDPEKKQYITRNHEPISIQVERSAE